MTTFSPDRLEGLMIIKKVSVNQVATRVKVSRQVVHKWLAGDQKPGGESLENLSKAYKVPVSYFYPEVRVPKAERSKKAA